MPHRVEALVGEPLAKAIESVEVKMARQVFRLTHASCEPAPARGERPIEHIDEIRQISVQPTPKKASCPPAPTRRAAPANVPK